MVVYQQMVCSSLFGICCTVLIVCVCFYVCRRVQVMVLVLERVEQLLESSTRTTWKDEKRLCGVCVCVCVCVYILVHMCANKLI